MKNIFWGFILVIICIFIVTPKDVFAVPYVNRNSLIEIDYRIVDNQNGLTYKLYDKNKIINLESTYDSSSNSYVFLVKQESNDRNQIFTRFYLILLISLII